jgi:tetratricopeptide (TPR) repeat protein
MTRQLAIPIALLTASLVAAAQSPDKEPPPTPEREALDKLLEPIRAGDARAAQLAYEQLAKAFPGKEVADEAAWHYACFHSQQGHLDKAQDLLLSLKRSGRENRWVSLAVIGLSEVAQKRGDERAMLGYLEEALKARAAPTGRNLMDTLDTRQEATLRLARHYRDKGDFKKALDYFTRWEPQSWCGTCLASMRAEREQEIILCQLRLGDHATIIRDGFRQLQKNDWLSNFHAWVLWRLYGDAGQLGDLRAMLDDYDNGRKGRPRGEQGDPLPTRGLRDLLRVQALAEMKDVAALVTLCQEEIRFGSLQACRDGRRDLVHSAAAEALAGVGGVEVEAIKSALGKRPQVTGWLIYSLGRSSAPSALEVLKEAAERTGDRDYDSAENIAYALALKGEPGREVLKRLAEKKSATGEAAREWLKRKAEPAWPAPTWPRPKAGSLPKTLPDPR